MSETSTIDMHVRDFHNLHGVDIGHCIGAGGQAASIGHDSMRIGDIGGKGVGLKTQQVEERRGDGGMIEVGGMGSSVETGVVRFGVVRLAVEQAIRDKRRAIEAVLEGHGQDWSSGHVCYR